MTKKKTASKAKQLVRVRKKHLANGNASLYLDIYYNGKRSYEFLKMYLVAEKTAADKLQNKNTLLIAETIRADKQKALLSGQAGLTSSNNAKMTISDLLRLHIAEYEAKGKCTGIAENALLVVNAYDGNVRLKDLTRDYYTGIVKYMQNATKVVGKEENAKEVKRWAAKTIHNYVEQINIALNNAAQRDIIAINPFTKVATADKVKNPDGTREYLTIEELTTLLNTDTTNPLHKLVYRAFAFSCFVGLRLSDVQALTWGHIVTSNGRQQIEMTMKKTKEQICVPLSANALKWLPVRGEASDKQKVFDFPHHTTISNALHQWAKDAKISKNVTFHVARHTFATMHLTLGADLYTISKILGHKDIKTTQVYAKVVDAKKVEAVSLTDKLSF